MTSRAANAVWRLPWALNGLMRTRRWTPCSERSQPVGVAALDDERRRRDAGLGARGDRLDLDVEAVLLGPAEVHAQQHVGPVLGVGAALAGLDLADRVALVVLAGEQGPQLERSNRGEAGDGLVDLGFDGVVGLLPGQLGQRLGVVDPHQRARRRRRGRRDRPPARR